MPSYDFRDPLYGFITLDALELEIIDTPYFQRLRHIQQLGTTSFVYPTACHTRFEHSLGTLHASSILFDHLVADEENRRILGWSKPAIQKMRHFLRLAALLHDVGQPPFSHATEDIFPKGRRHEDFTYEVIKDTEIGTIIDKRYGRGAGLRVADIAAKTARGKEDNFVSELLAGEIGTDRMDYLLRDSYHLGVAYGRFDIHRLLNSLHIRENREEGGPELAIDEGGVHTVEGFVLARYFMFLNVYFHKTRRILDLHLCEYLKSILPHGCYPTKLDDYISLTDHDIVSRLILERSEDLAARVIGRKHFRLIRETKDHPTEAELVEFDWFLEEAFKKFGVANLRTDEATKSPHNYTVIPLFVVGTDRGYEAITKRSSLIGGLKQILKVRLYSNQDIKADVKEFEAQWWADRKNKRKS